MPATPDPSNADHSDAGPASPVPADPRISGRASADASVASRALAGAVCLDTAPAWSVTTDIAYVGVGAQLLLGPGWQGFTPGAGPLPSQGRYPYRADPPGCGLPTPDGRRRAYPDPEETGDPVPAWIAGFALGGELDDLPAGLTLAGCAARARESVVGEDELIGVLRAWRRLASWAAAGELEAIAALARRSPSPMSPAAKPEEELPFNVGEFVADEVQAALTLTPMTAWMHTDLALAFTTRLRPVRDSLAAGWIDLPRAQLFHTATRHLSDAHAAAVVAMILPQAPDMTTGQLRRALERAVLAADPDAARRTREENVKRARVDCWPDPCGTANLAGQYLPSADTLAADRRLTAIAQHWKAQGALGDLDQLRARAYLLQLLGGDPDTVPADLIPAMDGRPDAVEHAVGHDPDGVLPVTGSPPPLAGSVHLTVPLTTLLGLGDSPGEAGGYGPLDADTARALACAAAGHRSTRWHITITGPTGRALGFGATTGGHKTKASGWQASVTAEPIAVGCCDHRTQESQYRPSAALQRLICARSRFCTYPGCRRPARKCDQDHTVPYDDGGITCECNIAPLCRHHHRMKQAQDWTLEQVTPGVMAWLTPAGRRYTTLPSQHPT